MSLGTLYEILIGDILYLFRRLSARFIDFILIVIAENFIWDVFNHNKVIRIIILLCLSLLISSIFNKIFGATLGKLILRIKVLKDDKSIPKFNILFKREILVIPILYIIYNSNLNNESYLSIFILIIYFAPILFKRKKKLLHDTILATHIVSNTSHDTA